MTGTEELVRALAERVTALEDKLAILELMTAYGPAIDSGSADAVARLWTEDGVYDVERAVALRDLEGVVIAEYQDLGGEADAGGLGGQEPEGRERVPVGAAALDRDVGGDGDVLAAGEVVVAEAVGGAGDRGQLRDAGAEFPVLADGGVRDDDGWRDSYVHQVVTPLSVVGLSSPL